MIKFWGGVVSLLMLLLVGLTFAPWVDAAQVCDPTGAQVEQFRIGCTVGYGSRKVGYCKIDGTIEFTMMCPYANCTSGLYYEKVSRCVKLGGGWGDIDDDCIGNYSVYSVLTSSKTTTQCYVYCNENNWSVCTGCEGTQTNDCGTTRACGGPCCSATAPTNLTVNKIATNIWQLTWTKGGGGVSQRVYVGTNKANVESNCASAGCTVKDEAVDVNAQSYNINNLTAGTVYYYRVVTYQSSSCSSNSTTLTKLSSCNVDQPSITLPMGDTTTLTTQVLSSSEIGSVAYVKSGPFINVNPASDTTYIYSTNVTGVSVGSGTITSNVRNPGGATICSDISNVTVTLPNPWWQVKDGDVTTNGNLNSSVPPAGGLYFDIIGSGGYPGIPAYGGSTSLTGANVSVNGWLANSGYNATKVYNSAYYLNAIPADTVINNLPSPIIDGASLSSGTIDPTSGYYWYEYDPAGFGGIGLTISTDISLGNKKVILIAKEADITMMGDINLTKGQGFFLLVAGAKTDGSKGNIIVDQGVGGGAGPNLEGIFVTDGQFQTGTSGSASDSQLWIRGTVAAYGGITLQRDLSDNSVTPAELFEFAPDLELLFPRVLGARSVNWQEVAP